MKHYYLAAICLFAIFKLETAHAQSLSSPCGDDYWREKALQNPEFYPINQAYEQSILKVFEQKNHPAGLAEQAKVLPVVVHIIHDGGPENISDAEVQQAITWLNQALANQGQFNQGSGTDCGIQLCLAQRTPDGQVTNGITRNQSTLTEMQMETQDLSVKNLNRWKPKDYVNIWLVRSICSTTYGCGVYGYANYPYAHGTTIDGIVIEAEYLTQIGKITGLAHETGHYLGLYHTFEGGCTNNNCMLDGDRICDTPPDQSTAGVPCGDLVSTCTTDVQSGPFTTDQPDMSWNFMDYGIIACFHDFSPDQSTRMNATIEGARHSLLDSKGCLPPCPNPVVAAFTPSATSITVGQTVTFNNTSQNAGSYLWTINGTPFGSQSNAAYNFTDPGTYTITLTAQPSNPSLCDLGAASVVIQVVCDVTASFTTSALIIDAGQTIYLSNTSQNALQTEWFLNGISQGASLDSLIFSTAGTYDVTLMVQNGPCQSTATVEISVQGICDEDHRLFQFAFRETPTETLEGRSVTILKDGNLLFLFEALEEKLGMVKMTPAGQQLWSKSLSDNILKYASTGGMAATEDGGFVVAFSSVDTEQRGYVAKFSGDGDLVWLQKFNSNVQFHDLVVTQDGKITLCGNDYIPTVYRVLFAQLEADGTVQWVRSYQSPGSYWANSIAAMADGTFVASGQEGQIFHLSANGDMIWGKAFDDAEFSDVTISEAGEIVACGGNNALSKLLFLKITADGTPTLVKQYALPTSFNYYFTKIIKDGQNGFVLPASIFPFIESGLVHLDSEGNLFWARKNSSPTSNLIYDIALYKDLGYVMVGNYGNPEFSGWALKTDLNGRIGTCPSELLSLIPSDLPIVPPTPLTPLEKPAPSVSPSTVPVQVWSVTPDTICALSCASPIEICNNNFDDDGDGLFDCLDPDCNCTEDRCDPKQSNVWYFGQNSGLDFNTVPPTFLFDGQTNNQGISATMCDVKGKLLFYTDGLNVFNRFHQMMPNGELGTSSQIFQTLIIPHPGNAAQYFVVVVYQAGASFFSLVDMTLNDGRGDVVASQKNLLLSNIASGIAAVKACSFQGYWLLTRTHELDSKFLAFRIDGSGLNLNPVSSSTGQAVGIVRQLKISPDGKSIACNYFKLGNPDSCFLSIYRFDPYTSAVVSDPAIIAGYKTPNDLIGVEFSPNGRCLYATGTFPGNAKLIQFDLEAGDLAAIRNSLVKVATLPGQIIYYLQLGPDGKIYAPERDAFNPPPFYFLGVIHQPNLPGPACQFEHNGVEVTNGGAWYGLCNVISSNFVEPQSPTLSTSAPDTICQLNVPINYQLVNVQCGVDSIVWQVENLNVQIQPTYQNASIRYLNPGSGRLIVTAYMPCGSATDTLDILVAAPLNKTLNLGPDLVVCQNGVFSFNAGSGFTRYLWSDGTADSTTTTLFPGKYWVKVWDLCGNLQTDTITVSIAPGSVLDLGPDLPQQCSGFSASYQRPVNFDSWKWSPDTFLNCTDCPEVTLSPNVSAQWVVVAQTDQGCISVDTLNATIRDTLLFSRDTFVCEGQTLAFLGAQLPADTTAEFFLPAPGIGCDTLLTVNVLGIENSASAVTVTICADAFYAYHGAWLPADTVAVFHLSSAQACDSVVTVKVNAFPPLNLTLPMDTTIRIGASVLLEADVDGSGTLDFVWSPPDGLSCIACPDPLANPLDTITYTLAVTDKNGCTAQESVTIRVNEECRIQIPTAFTPNGDGSNDRFRPIMDPCVRTVRLWRIVNRWGQTVFEQVNLPAMDTGLGWDGSWNGKAHPSDVLVWMAEFEYYDGRRETERGELTLVR